MAEQINPFLGGMAHIGSSNTWAACFIFHQYNSV